MQSTLIIKLIVYHFKYLNYRVYGIYCNVAYFKYDVDII